MYPMLVQPPAPLFLVQYLQLIEALVDTQKSPSGGLARCSFAAWRLENILVLLVNSPKAGELGSQLLIGWPGQIEHDVRFPKDRNVHKRSQKALKQLKHEFSVVKLYGLQNGQRACERQSRGNRPGTAVEESGVNAPGRKMNPRIQMAGPEFSLRF